MLGYCEDRCHDTGTCEEPGHDGSRITHRLVDLHKPERSAECCDWCANHYYTHNNAPYATAGQPLRYAIEVIEKP